MSCRTALWLTLVCGACGGAVEGSDALTDSDQGADSDDAEDADQAQVTDDDLAPLELSIAGDAVIVAMAGEPVSVAAFIGEHVPPLTYVWTSSLDGVLATTDAFTSSSLSAGDHTLELRVTDAAGAAASDTTTLHVLPRQFDWSHKLLPSAPPASGDWMTPVKNQDTCGSCWSHAALGAMEARWNIQNGDPTLDIDLSEQWLIDCHHEGAVGCGGGAPEQALDFISQHGVPSEACNPFLGHNDTCSATCDGGATPQLYTITARRTFLGAHADVQAWTRDVLVHDGPVPRHMGGIYYWNASTLVCDNLAGDHYVVVVGYDHDAGVWLARNSWGAAWNGNGYLKIKYGTCGMDASSIALGNVSAP